MRTLALIRHAKSSWKFPKLDDHDRPLNTRGQRDCITMANWLADNNIAPNILYSSPATRALTFAEKIGQAIALDPQLNSNLYTFDTNSLLSTLRQLPNSAEHIAIVAHNPAITNAVNTLTGATIQNIPTAGIAIMSSNIGNWVDIKTRTFKLNQLVFPKLVTRLR